MQTARVVLARAFLPILLVCASGAIQAAEQELPPATNALERMHLKNAKCVWTKEIGDYIYQCLKDNFGMNAHWCHNEAMEVLCPQQQDSAAAVSPK